jgi:hypothetical protein
VWQEERDASIEQLSLEPELPDTVNVRRLLAYTWDLALRNDAERAWDIVADDSWNKLQQLKKLADLDAHPFENIRCEHCVLRDLLLATPLMPTRVVYSCQRVKDWDAGCTLCVRQGEPFFVHGFDAKSGLPHLKEIEGRKGWTDRGEFEHAMREWVKMQVLPPVDLKEGEEWKPPVIEVAAVTVQAPKEKEVEEDSRPVDKMRLAIWNYENTYKQCNAVSHPWACRCQDCEWRSEKWEDYKVDGDNVALFCQWARRRRMLTFYQLVSGALEDAHKVIPYCSQYSPREKNWQGILAPLQQNVLWPRALLLRACEQVYGRVRANVSISEAILLHLNGRPMSNSATFRNWYTQQLGEQKGELTNAHLSILLEWLLARWAMMRHDYSQEGSEYVGYLANASGVYEPWWKMSYEQQEEVDVEEKEEAEENNTA